MKPERVKELGTEVGELIVRSFIREIKRGEREKMPSWSDDFVGCGKDDLIAKAGISEDDWDRAVQAAEQAYNRYFLTHTGGEEAK